MNVVETIAAGRMPTLGEATRVWARIGFLSFGGPAGQIALMHKELVEERRWVGEERFLHALNYCMLLPGPEAQQLAVYIGWLMHRTVGGLIAGLLFILPGALVMLGLSILYVTWRHVPLVDGIFFGVKAAVLAAAPVVTSVYAAPDEPKPSTDDSKKKKKGSEFRPNSDRTFAAGYRSAYDAIYSRGEYTVAIDQLKKVRRDRHR